MYRDQNTMQVTIAGSFTRSGNDTVLATTTLKPSQEQVIFAYQLYSNTDKLRYASSGKIHLLSSSTSGSAYVYSSFYLPIGG